MTIKTEVEVEQLKGDVEQLKQFMQQAFGALNATIERVEALEGRDNATIEGDEIIRPASNGKIKTKKTDR